MSDIMRIIRTNIIPIGRGFGAINLFGILFVKKEMKLTREVINHEKIHTCQMRELGYVPFYIIYVLEWLLRMVQHRGRIYESYYAISFEREAYANADNLRYRANREHFAQWR